MISGATGTPIAQLDGNVVWGGLGNVVHGVGDVDGDGLSDIGARNDLAVEIWSLRPTGVAIDGVACLGASGRRAVIGASGTPTPGSTFSVFLSKVPQPVPALLLIGVPAGSWGGAPLPFDLAPVGLPGCQLGVPILGTVPAFTKPRPGPGIGGAAVSILIPPDPALVGASAAFQWYCADPGPAFLPGVTTRRLVATVQ